MISVPPARPRRAGRFLPALAAALSALAPAAAPAAPAAARPNIVYFLADDLGYGDVQALNPGQAVRMKVLTARKGPEAVTIELG